MSTTLPATDLVDFSVLLRGVQGLRTGRAELPQSDEYAWIRLWLDLSMGEAWHAAGHFPELKVWEERYFRDLYDSSTTYAKEAEVYDAATQKYYQSLRDSNTQPPSVSEAENSAYWAESKTRYTGANWVTDTAYVVGDIRFYPVTNRYYQCHTAHTSSSTLTPDATGANERWGRLTDFARYILHQQTGKTVIGVPLMAATADPRVHADYDMLTLRRAAGRVYIVEDVVRCHLCFRAVRPRFTGAAWDSTASYSVGDQVYFAASTSAAGNLYDCVASAAAGESPATDPTKWAQVEIPRVLETYLIASAYAKSLAGDQQDNRFRLALAAAAAALDNAADDLERQQAQTEPIRMDTY